MQSSDISEINYSASYQTAVCLKDLCKHYGNNENGKKLVLNKFCMRVRKGSIYGFLGASGCGKTTVLSCIVGLRKWDSGQVLVFGREPGSKESGIPGRVLGYMPQELALYNQLSIIETLIFYGRLYGLSDSVIRKQWNVLSELLNLSNSGPKLIGALSGGQKRRASLAVALIHSPQLLVLDEPTVGLDPVLRKNIWDYLHQIVGRLETTIIITTHYIEEARYSDMIGLMRRGRMLVEQSPNELINHYQSESLEQIVMQICKLDQMKISATDCDTAEAELKQSEKLTFKTSWKLKNEQNVQIEGEFRALPYGDTEKGYHGDQNLNKKSDLKYSKTLQSLQRTCGFTWVIFIIFIRHPVFLIMIVLMPAIQGSLTLWAVGSKPIGLPLGIINHEVGDWISACDSTKNQLYIESEIISDCQLSSGMKLKNLSCRYLNQLKKDKLVDLIVFSNEQEARLQVKLGNSWGYLTIPKNFSQSFGDLLLAKQFAMQESIIGSKIPIHLDYSQYISSLFITRNMYTSYSNFLKEIAKSCSIDEKLADVPLEFRKPIYGDNEDNYTAFVMPGLLLFTIFGIACALSGLLLINDRRQGTLSRATVAGLSCSNVIISHIIVQEVLTIAQLAIWNIVLYYVFSIPFNGEIGLYVSICLLNGLSGSTWGLLVGLIVDTEANALHIGTFCSYILLLYGGVLWPVEAMTKSLQTVGSILPTYLPTQSLRSVIVRGVGTGHPLVWPGILASIFWTTGFIIFVVILYRKKT